MGNQNQMKERSIKDEKYFYAWNEVKLITLLGRGGGGSQVVSVFR